MYVYIYIIYIHTRQPKNFSYWLSGHYEGEPVRNINIPLGESGNLGVADHGEKQSCDALLCSNGGIVTVYTSPYFHILSRHPTKLIQEVADVQRQNICS
jgi:hypothetical protein